MEDNAKTIINVAGDYVQSKHVDYEINNVEAGGIGIQFVNGKQIPSASSSPKSKSVTPMRPKHFLETVTFKYLYLNSADGNRRLSLLYQFLCKEYRETKSYIVPETTPDEFFSLFAGETNNTVVTWTGSKQDLYYFVKRMVERHIINIPNISTIWTITQNHFSDRRGNLFLDLRNQHNLKNSAEAIERLIDILDPTATTSADLTEISKKLSTAFGGK